LADLNADGRLDLITQANGVFVQLGNGTGKFGVATQVLENSASGIAVGDFNRDGKLDLAATHFPETGSILLGNGNGTFRSPLEFSPGPDDGPLAATDANKDGWLDLVVGNQDSSAVTILKNRRRW
jgi:hypothetical protein